jgi:hypothetical protein
VCPRLCRLAVLLTQRRRDCCVCHHQAMSRTAAARTKAVLTANTRVITRWPRLKVRIRAPREAHALLSHGCNAATGPAASAGQLCVSRGGEGAVCGSPPGAPAHRPPRRRSRRLCVHAAVPGAHGAAAVRPPTPNASLRPTTTAASLTRRVHTLIDTQHSALPGTYHALLGVCPRLAHLPALPPAQC